MAKAQHGVESGVASDVTETQHERDGDHRQSLIRTSVRQKFSSAAIGTQAEN